MGHRRPHLPHLRSLVLLADIFLVYSESPGLVKAQSPADTLTVVLWISNFKLSNLVIGVNFKHLGRLLGAMANAGQLNHIHGLELVDGDVLWSL